MLDLKKHIKLFYIPIILIIINIIKIILFNGFNFNFTNYIYVEESFLIVFVDKKNKIYLLLISIAMAALFIDLFNINTPLAITSIIYLILTFIKIIYIGNNLLRLLLLKAIVVIIYNFGNLVSLHFLGLFIVNILMTYIFYFIKNNYVKK